MGELILSGREPQQDVTVEAPLGQDGLSIGVRVLKGDQGVQGVPGPEGGFYAHTQGLAATVWTVQHNLGRPPAAIRVVSTEGNLLEPIVTDVNDNITLLTFPDDPRSGSAWVS